MSDTTVHIKGFTSNIIVIGLMIFGVYLLGTIGTWWAGVTALVVMVGIGCAVYRLGMSFAEAGLKLGMRMGENDESSTSW